jgi:hypothetical protein
LSVSISDTASFLTRLRQISSSSPLVAALGLLRRTHPPRLPDREVGLGLQDLERVVHALPVAFPEPVEYLERGIQAALRDRVVHPVAIAVEFRDVTGQEVTAVAVQRLDVPVEYQRRDGVVDRRLPIVGALEDAAHEPRDPGFAIGRREAGAGRGRRRVCRAEQQRAGRNHCGCERRGAAATPLAGARRRLFPITCLIHFLTSIRFPDQIG